MEMENNELDLINTPTPGPVMFQWLWHSAGILNHTPKSFGDIYELFPIFTPILMCWGYICLSHTCIYVSYRDLLWST